mgnify:CR=1 FL=1|tara:strand:+ start:651 stop:887 length:237 start_codon:yes stop_codon:yes gene_type:complete
MNVVENIKKDFLRYGFSNSPLSDDEIKTLLGMAWLDADDVFDIGCDMVANQFTTIEEAAEWYEIRNKQARRFAAADTD